MSTFNKIGLLIAFGSYLVSATLRPPTYNLPAPRIQALGPRGLRVSIPHTVGIELFAFHGNINQPLADLEAGQLSRDVIIREGNSWVFKDRHVKLKVGDTIYYWLYVIKDGLGYRYDNGVYVVKGQSLCAANIEFIKAVTEITRENPDSEDGTSTKSPNTIPQEKCDPDLRFCEKLILNLTQALLDLRYEVESLREANVILRKIAQRHPDQSRTLILSGVTVNDNDLQSTVQAVVTQKLGIPIRVENIVKKDNGIVTFQVPTIDDAVAVIRAGKEKLKNSQLDILY